MTTHEVPMSVRRADERARETTVAIMAGESIQRTAFMARVHALVMTGGSVVRPAVATGYVYVYDGRTGRDACEETAEEAFRVLFEAADADRLEAVRRAAP